MFALLTLIPGESIINTGECSGRQAGGVGIQLKSQAVLLGLIVEERTPSKKGPYVISIAESDLGFFLLFRNTSKHLSPSSKTLYNLDTKGWGGEGFWHQSAHQSARIIVDNVRLGVCTHVSGPRFTGRGKIFHKKNRT